VSVELYREYAERRVELIQELRAKGVTELDRAIEAAQRLLDRILFIAFAEDRGLLPDRNLLLGSAAQEHFRNACTRSIGRLGVNNRLYLPLTPW
jgi:hypothetical protein